MLQKLNIIEIISSEASPISLCRLDIITDKTC